MTGLYTYIYVRCTSEKNPRVQRKIKISFFLPQYNTYSVHGLHRPFCSSSSFRSAAFGRGKSLFTRLPDKISLMTARPPLKNKIKINNKNEWSVVAVSKTTVCSRQLYTRKSRRREGSCEEHVDDVKTSKILTKPLNLTKNAQEK